MKIELRSLKECINEDLYQMYQNIPCEEIGSINKFHGLNYDEFVDLCDEYIKEEVIINSGINTTTKRFILFVNDYPVGEVGIRTTLSDFWINKGSQIFYKIRLSERGKGYGNIILNLALKQAKKLGFKQIRINCNNENYASKKIIIKNGGVVDIKDYKTSEGISSSYIIKLD